MTPANSRKIRHNVFLTIVLTGILILYGACRLPDPGLPVPRAVDGVLDLSDWDFERDGPVELNGEWLLHWQQLLAPGADAWSEGDSIRVVLPATWNDFEIAGRQPGAIGYGTFRLRLVLPQAPEIFRLRIPEIGSAYRLYADQVLIASAGIVAPDRETSRGEWTIRYAEIPAQPHVDLVLQISNHRFRSGGAWRAIKLGERRQMVDRQIQATGVELFLIGAFLMIGLNHLTVFAGRPGFRATFYFGVLCLICILQVLVSGEQLFHDIFPGLSYRGQHTILFLAIFCAIPIFALFEYHVFPNIFRRWALRGILIGSAVFVGLALVLPTLWLTGLHVFYKPFVLLSELYMFLVVCLALKSGDPSARYFLAGLLILIPSTMIDVLLLSSSGFRYQHLVSFSFFIFLLLQSIMLSRRFSTALAMAEQKETTEIRLLQSELDFNKASVALEKIKFERLKNIIQPHYLLNTLTALLHWVKKSPAQAEGIVRDLAVEFQKVHLYSQLDLVTVAQEVELCEAHIRIMGIRYDKEIRFETGDLDPDEKIPPLIFHTLVENAFFHQNVSEIRIETIAPSHFVLSVQGVVRVDQKGLGIGASYIEARLRTAYGEAWELKDRATPDGWVTEIRIIRT